MNKIKTKIILIGGTSHSGKTTLGKHLAETLNFDYCAADMLARHPGRPWGSPQKPVPEHVIEHYSTLSVQDLFQDVMHHYELNVIPQIKTIIETHIIASPLKNIIIEGSAIWPNYVLDILNNNVSAFWLIADDMFLKDRIYKESGFIERNPSEQILINKFF